MTPTPMTAAIMMPATKSSRDLVYSMAKSALNPASREPTITMAPTFITRHDVTKAFAIFAPSPLPAKRLVSLSAMRFMRVSASRHSPMHTPTTTDIIIIRILASSIAPCMPITMVHSPSAFMMASEARLDMPFFRHSPISEPITIVTVLTITAKIIIHPLMQILKNSCHMKTKFITCNSYFYLARLIRQPFDYSTDLPHACRRAKARLRAISARLLSIGGSV